MTKRFADLPLAVHVLALAVLLAVSTAVSRPATPWTTDEGAYALQARLVHDGRWSLEWQGRRVDPSLAWYPIVNGSTSEHGEYPYVSHPLAPAALAVATAALGETAGLAALPAVGAIAAAVAAAAIATELGARRRVRNLAFWTAATGPLLMDGHLLWAHAPGAAAGGFVVLAGLRILRDPLRDKAGRAAVAWGAAAAVVGSLLRSEVVLLALAVAAALGVALLVRRRVADAVVSVAAIGGAAVVTVVAEARWRAAITGGGASVSGLRQQTGSFVGGRLSGGYHSLLWPSTGSRAADLLWLAGLGLALVAGIAGVAGAAPAGAERDRRASAGLLLGAVAVAVAAAAAHAHNPGNPITGFVPAWGLAVPGVAAAALRRADPGARLALAATALAMAAVAATQYAEGGGLEWGGRFFTTVAAPALAAVAAIGVAALTEDRRAAALAVALLMAVPVLAAETNLHHRRDSVARVVDELAAARPTVVITTSEALPRNAWRTQPASTWFRAPEVDLPRVLAAVAGDPGLGAGTVELVVPAAVDVDALARAVGRTAERRPAPTLAGLGAQVVVVRAHP